MTAAPRIRAGAGEPSLLPPIAVTMGDPAGIGPDITLMSWHAARAARAAPVRALRRPRRCRRAGARARPGRAAGDRCEPRRGSGGIRRRAACAAGPAGSRADAAIVAAIERGVAAVAGGAALALVTNPIAKRSLDLANLPYPGHTEFLAELAVRYCGGARPRPVMMLAAEELKVVPATVHIPLAGGGGRRSRGRCCSRRSASRRRRSRAISASRSRASRWPGSTRMPAKAA